MVRHVGSVRGPRRCLRPAAHDLSPCARIGWQTLARQTDSCAAAHTLRGRPRRCNCCENRTRGLAGALPRAVCLAAHNFAGESLRGRLIRARRAELGVAVGSVRSDRCELVQRAQPSTVDRVCASVPLAILFGCARIRWRIRARHADSCAARWRSRGVSGQGGAEPAGQGCVEAVRVGVVDFAGCPGDVAVRPDQ